MFSFLRMLRRWLWIVLGLAERIRTVSGDVVLVPEDAGLQIAERTLASTLVVFRYAISFSVLATM